MIKDMDLTEVQKDSLANCISDHIGHEVEITHCQDESDCRKVFYIFERDNGRVNRDSMYFTACIGESLVTDFEETIFN